MTSSRSSMRINLENGQNSPRSPSRLSVKHNLAGHSRTLSLESISGALNRNAKLPATITVNVAVRVRPPVGASKVIEPDYSPSPKNVASVVDSISPTSISVSTNIAGGIQAGPVSGSKKFIFDRVFDEATPQIGIFEHVKDSIPSLIKGYNVSIMAYGQSGSGKSYTMGTSDNQDDEATMGIISRASKELFDELNILKRSEQTAALPSQTLSINNTAIVDAKSDTINNTANTSVHSSSDSPWAVAVSYLEIYNEQFRDLLNASTTPSNISVREDIKGNIIVHGLRQVLVDSADEILQKLNQGSSVRQTNSTAINSQSSRSHAIFSIHLTQKQVNPDTGIITTITSKLNLVDLAGSERLKNTKATDGRVKEGISINSGLTSLGKVISQLSLNPNDHISYRDSKLTRVLQDSLGGKALTYLIACITTESIYLNETIGTLTYAQRARSIQVTPEIQASQSKDDLLLTIENLRKEVSYWKNRVEPSSPNLGYRSPSPLTRSMFSYRTSSPSFDGGPITTPTTVKEGNPSSFKFPPISSPPPVSSIASSNLSTPNLSSFSTPFLPSTSSISLIPKYSLRSGTPRMEKRAQSEALTENELSSPSSLMHSPQIYQKERLQRSEELQHNVNTVIEDYEKTIASLQNSLSESRKQNEILTLEKDQLSAVNDELNRYTVLLENKLQAQSGTLEEYEQKLAQVAEIQKASSSSESSADVPSLEGQMTNMIAPVALVRSLETQITELKSELENRRRDHKHHLAESQYLTMQYNNARNEVTQLINELQSLRTKQDQVPPQLTKEIAFNSAAITSLSDISDTSLEEPKTPPHTSSSPELPYDSPSSLRTPLSKRNRLPAGSLAFF
ncbi:tubulin-dependent ATPase KIP3 [Sugiyamaella lignohabitans]|uniref:Kinesin-like protein n=1 Tax=Sugiyamaella lignohabitans TaxID=796027 RepID=A0A167FZ84_9ASCO|nr:tubulin-dependent ATPase KIP3 [Sugiyamaella lignohabitans]ANB15893.1 tubulin-dependent ATPase KIP3 [Sugiyamaella lignohabitans]